MKKRGKGCTERKVSVTVAVPSLLLLISRIHLHERNLLATVKSSALEVIDDTARKVVAYLAARFLLSLHTHVQLSCRVIWKSSTTTSRAVFKSARVQTAPVSARQRVLMIL